MNDALAILILGIALGCAIAALIGWLISIHNDRKEAMPELAQTLEDRPDKRTAITYGKKRGPMDIRYVPPTEPITIVEVKDA